MSFAPTAEQAAIVTAAVTGQNLVIQAGAGTGKTSTLALIAEALSDKRCIYIAFNKAIATRRAPWAATSRPTAHSLAFQAVGKRYATASAPAACGPARSQDLLGARPVTIKTASDEVRMYSDRNVARMAMDMVAQFCRTADDAITAEHFPLTEGIDGATPSGRIIRGDNHGSWRATACRSRRPSGLTAQREGRLPFSHDYYLKMYQMSTPKITGDVLFLDEAQDANPVIASIVEAQDHLQVILVGDSSQAIYGFTGAVDAMAKFEAAAPSMMLTQSFRFGPAVADIANVFLDALDAPLRITGFGPRQRARHARPAGRPTADAVLCRTNAGCLRRTDQRPGPGPQGRDRRRHQGDPLLHRGRSAPHGRSGDRARGALLLRVVGRRGEVRGRGGDHGRPRDHGQDDREVRHRAAPGGAPQRLRRAQRRGRHLHRAQEQGPRVGRRAHRRLRPRHPRDRPGRPHARLRRRDAGHEDARHRHPAPPTSRSRSAAWPRAWRSWRPRPARSRSPRAPRLRSRSSRRSRRSTPRRSRSASRRTTRCSSPSPPRVGRPAPLHHGAGGSRLRRRARPALRRDGRHLQPGDAALGPAPTAPRPVRSRGDASPPERRP